MYRKRRMIGLLISILLLAGIGFGLQALVREGARLIGGNGASPTTDGRDNGGLFGSGGLFGPAGSSPGTSGPTEPLTGEDQILAFLMQMDTTQSRRIADQLEALTARRDVTGYHANLYQASVRESEPGGDAAASYRRALALFESRDVRLLLAQALVRQNDTEAAWLEYVALLPDESAYARLLALQSDPVLLCDTLLKKSMYTQAREQAVSLRSGATDPLLQARLAACEAIATAAAGDYNTALPLFDSLPATINPGAVKLAEGDGDAAVAGSVTASAINLSITHPVSVSWWYARTLEGAGQSEKAIPVYRALEAAGGERLGALLEKKGLIKEAAAAYLSAPVSASKWRGAKLAEQTGEGKKALAGYLELVGRTDNLYDDAAYRAYVLLRRQKKSDGEEAKSCTAVLSQYPSWMKRLGLDYTWPETAQGEPVRPVWLDRKEQFDAEGRTELGTLAYAIGIRETTTGEKLYLAQWNLEKEDQYASVVWGMRALKEEKSIKAYRYAYPRAYESQVKAFSEEFQVDPLLIWSVMRTESTYRADVRSRSGAIGLMQIMPATGQDIAGRLKVAFAEDDLLNPEVNVRFGAFYIGAMIRQFEGNWDHAIAAYNGGAGNTRKWLKSTMMKAKEDFPTAIAFDESREYITKVMEAYYIYKWLDKQ